MPTSQTFNVTEFKAKCLDILDRLGKHEFERVIVTKRGKAVAILTPPEADAAAVHQIHGFMRNSVVVPEGIDLTAPVSDEPFGAAAGELHG